MLNCVSEKIPFGGWVGKGGGGRAEQNSEPFEMVLNLIQASPWPVGDTLLAFPEPNLARSCDLRAGQLRRQ